MRTLLLAVSIALFSSVSAQAGDRMLFIGDSITFGVWAEPLDAGFVPLIAERFPELDVVNAGCNGATVRDWTIDDEATDCFYSGAWPELAEPNLPAAMTHVLLGTNDSVGIFEWGADEPGGPVHHGFVVSPEEYDARLRELIDRIDGWVFLSVPPVRTDGQPPEVADRLLAYRQVVLDIVESEPQVLLGVDLQELLDPETDFQEGIHPNTLGHAKIADALEQSILASTPFRRIELCNALPFLCGFGDLVSEPSEPGGFPDGLSFWPGGLFDGSWWGLNPWF
jgi:lysophospholipase L1-like esterase